MEMALPDINVTVQAGGSDVAVVALFKSDDGDWDAVCGICDAAQLTAVMQALAFAGDALHQASWKPISEVGNSGTDARAGEETGDPNVPLPF
jgi:hypothetical protein